MMTWARDLNRAPLRGGDRGVAPTRDLDQRSLQCCVAVTLFTLHLSVEQREPVHRVVAGRGPSNLSTKVFTIFGEGEGPYFAAL